MASELHQFQIPFNCSNIRQCTFLILKCIPQCLVVLDQTDERSVNTLVHKHIRHQLIFNLHDEQFISVITEHDVGYINFLIQMKDLVVQYTPEV